MKTPTLRFSLAQYVAEISVHGRYLEENKYSEQSLQEKDSTFLPWAEKSFVQKPSVYV